MKKIGNWMLSGAVVILPIGATIYAFVWLFNILDGILRDIIIELFGRYIPGLGIVVMVLSVLVIGILASNVFGKTILGFFQGRLGKIPFIKMIYNPINKIVSDFSSKSSDRFKNVVLVEFPVKGIKSVGFITNSHLKINGEDKIIVFVPTVPNPANGHMIIINPDEAEIVDVSIAEGVNMIITIGTVIEKEFHSTGYKKEDNKMSEIID